MRRKNSWKLYMKGECGTSGYYVKNKYGPFKNKKTAEFFNFLAFVHPKSFDAEKQSKENIKFAESLKESKHPKMMFNQNSPFSIWWHDTFGKHLTEDMVMMLAHACRANGYRSFIDWLLRGCKIQNTPIHCQYNSSFI